MKITLEFKKEDCWIGLFWKSELSDLDVWICLIPMFPIHINFHRGALRLEQIGPNMWRQGSHVMVGPRCPPPMPEGRREDG